MSALDGLIFPDDRDMPPPPAGVAERWITTDDALRLHAWFAPAAGRPERPPVIVWAHGNGGNIANRVDVIEGLAARGVDVLAFDYRGYGKSEGRPSEPGVYADARAAYDSERARGIPPERIVCFGESLGGAVSIALALDRPCAGVAVVSTFTSLRDVASVHYGPLAALARGRFDSQTRVQTLAVPLFLAHGDRDEIVPFALGERLFAVANEPKRFFRAAGAGHNDVFASPGLVDAIADFARTVTARGAAE